MKVQAESFHLNGHIIGFHLQTQKLESPYKTPSNTLAVKGLTHCLRRLGPSMFKHRLRKKNRKKSRYFRLPPNLAHRKLIALANYVPSSSPLRVLSFTQRFLKNVEKWRCVVRSIWNVFA